jgi:beta-phosphoglucomutase family hydrolase
VGDAAFYPVLVLGLPDAITACLFDLDGVLTPTAAIHEAAWKEMFDAFLKSWSGQHDQPFQAFDTTDYERDVDGKPRADGVRSFLASRGITLPDGSSDDPPSAETVNGLGNRKNILVLERIHTDGVAPYPGSRRYVDAVRAAGLARAVVSSSANAKDVLAAAGIADLFDTVVDGHAVTDEGLAGKPAPDTFLAAAKRLGVAPAAAAVFEDALAGMQAGKAGHFGFVVGVDRLHQADALRQAGGDIVVEDLADLLPA